MTKTPTPASHAVNTAPISADLRGIEQPQIGSHAVNEAAWAFVNQMPHQLPGPVFNDLKPAVHAAISEYLRQTAKNAPASPTQQDAPAAQPSRECLQQSAAPAPDSLVNAVADGLFDYQQIGGKVPAMDRDGFREIIGCAIDEAALQAAPPAPAGVAVPDEAFKGAWLAHIAGMHQKHDTSNNSNFFAAGYRAAAALAAAPAQAVAVPELDMDRVLSIADVHAEESREDGVRLLDRGGLVAFAKDVLREAGAPAQEHAPREQGKPFIVRLAEDFAEDCVNARYVKTSLASHARLVEHATQLAGQGLRPYIGHVQSVADLVNNLLLLEQTLPIYGAQYIEHPPGKRRAIAVPPTVSREQVKDSRWIGEGDTLNAAVIWTRAEQPAAPAMYGAGSATTGAQTATTEAGGITAEAAQERKPLTADQLADKCEAWLQAGGATNIVDAYEAGYRDRERAHGITGGSNAD